MKFFNFISIVVKSLFVHVHSNLNAHEYLSCYVILSQQLPLVRVFSRLIFSLLFTFQEADKIEWNETEKSGISYWKFVRTFWFSLLSSSITLHGWGNPVLSNYFLNVFIVRWVEKRINFFPNISMRIGHFNIYLITVLFMLYILQKCVNNRLSFLSAHSVRFESHSLRFE